MFDNKESIYHGYDSFYDSTNKMYQIRRTKFKNKNSKVGNSINEDPKGSEFYDKIKYLLIQLVIVGAIPVCKPGKAFKTRLFLIFVYCALVYGTLSSLSWFEFKRVCQEIKNISSLEYGVQIINRLLFLAQQFSIVLLIWPQSSNIIRNLRQWSEYQDQYERVTQQPFKLVKINNFLKFSLINLCVFIPVSWIYYRNLKGILKLGFWQSVLYCYLTITEVNLIKIWYFSARVGEIVTQDFLQRLKQRFNTFVSPSELQAYRLLWLKLSATVCDAGAMFSISTAEIIIALFINAVVFSYITVVQGISAITKAHKNETNYWIFYKSIFSQVFIIGVFFIICQKGYSLSQQNQVIKRHLMDMKIPKTLLKKDVMAEQRSLNPLEFSKEETDFPVFITILADSKDLRIFIRSVNISPVEFSIGGFKVINVALFVWILGDVVTYVIILVQFNLSLKSSLSSSLSSNSSLTSTGQLKLI